MLAPLAGVPLEWAVRVRSRTEIPVTNSTDGTLTRSDRRGLLLWLVLGIAGAIFAFQFYFAAFPEAAVNFQISRTEAQERSQQFVTGLGGDLAGYRSAIVFDVDENAKTYLERELGLTQANRMMSSEVSVWYWDVRFFRPQQEEEYRVRVSPSGRIAGYRHTIEEARAGVVLDRGAAESKAAQFLAAKYGAALGNWEFLPEEANSIKRPNRLDWSFTWEKRGFRAKEAPYRLRVTLQGDKIGGAEEFLQVPEAWERDYRRLRAGNNTLANVFIVPYLLLIGAAVAVGISLLRSGQTSWSAALKLGAIVAILLFLQGLNEWPLWGASYDTKSPYSSFLASNIALAALLGALSALPIALVLPAAEPFYRVSQPNQLRLGEVLTLRGIRSKEFFNSAFVGVCMAAMHIGFVVAFYLVGSRFGVWAPQDLNYSNIVNTSFPWISGAAIGLYAATHEEFVFRLFAIPFLQRLRIPRWAALVLPAFFWSFLHSNYPQEPPYIRGIEVGIIGIVAGLVMLRWGILATLIWHYTVDALLVGLLLIRSNSLYFKVSGAVVGAAAIAPLAFAGISYLLRGRFETDESLLNRAGRLPEIRLAAAARAEVAGPTTAKQYDALTQRTLAFLALCLVLGGILAWKLKPETIGDYLRLEVDNRAVRRIADETLRARKLHPEKYRSAVTLADRMDPLDNEYLRRAVGIAETNRIYSEIVPGVLWRVRYFRDADPEEYAVILRPDGSLHAVRHTLAEAAPGASLSKEEAVARAESFLREQKHFHLSQWRLVESTSEKRPHRIDHTLTWEQSAPLDSPGKNAAASTGDLAHARIEVQVLGDEVTNYRTYIKIPEAWRRAQEEQSLSRTLFRIGRSALLAGLALTALILFLKRLRSEAASSIPWRRLARWSLWGLAGFIFTFALGPGIPNLLSRYRTEEPFRLFAGETGLILFLSAAAIYGGMLLIFGLAWYFGSQAFGIERLPAWRGMPAVYYRDALWIGLGGIAVLACLDPLLVTLSRLWPTTHHAVGASIGSDFEALNPFAGILGAGVWRGLFSTGVIALVAAFIASKIRPAWARLGLFALISLALVGDWGSPADFAKQFLAQALALGVVVAGVRWIVRFNLLGCFLIAAGTRLLGGAAELLAQPDVYYRANGYALVLALTVFLAWPLAVWLLGAATPEPVSTQESIK